jgi:sarcosine oxidase, subunit beta
MLPTIDEAEVAIIGGGIIGCAIGYHLAKAGRTVVLIEKQDFGYMESGRNAGGVRQQSRDLGEIPLAMASVRMWKTLDEELECDTEYQRGGNLVLAMNETEAEHLKTAVARQQALGLTLQFISGKEARNLCPALADCVVAASYCATDGKANPMATTIGFGRAAMRAGVRALLYTEVTGVEVQHGEVRGVVTKSGVVRAPVVVNAAGPWARVVGRMAGCNVPVINRRNQIMATERLPPLFPQHLSGSTVYCSQTRSGSVVIGGSGPWEQVGFAASTSRETIMRYAGRSGALLPALKRAQLVRAWAAISGRTMDELPILGFMEHPKGLCNACGFSGHGFALGPIIGKLITELIVQGKPSLTIDKFSITRFAPDLDPIAAYERIRVQEPPPYLVANEKPSH